MVLAAVAKSKREPTVDKWTSSPGPPAETDGRREDAIIIKSTDKENVLRAVSLAENMYM